MKRKSQPWKFRILPDGVAIYADYTRRLRVIDPDGRELVISVGAAIMNLGSFPYADPEYHTEDDRAERADLPNVLLATQATLAAIMTVDQEGAP